MPLIPVSYGSGVEDKQADPFPLPGFAFPMWCVRAEDTGPYATCLAIEENYNGIPLCFLTFSRTELDGFLANRSVDELNKSTLAHFIQLTTAGGQQKLWEGIFRGGVYAPPLLVTWKYWGCVPDLDAKIQELKEHNIKKRQIRDKEDADRDEKDKAEQLKKLKDTLNSATYTFTNGGKLSIDELLLLLRGYEGHIPPRSLGMLRKNVKAIEIGIREISAEDKRLFNIKYDRVPYVSSIRTTGGGTEVAQDAVNIITKAMSGDIQPKSSGVKKK